MINQDLIDLINLNKLEDLNENSLLPESEKEVNAMGIYREKRMRMNRLRLEIPIPKDGKDRLGNTLTPIDAVCD